MYIVKVLSRLGQLIIFSVLISCFYGEGKAADKGVSDFAIRNTTSLHANSADQKRTKKPRSNRKNRSPKLSKKTKVNSGALTIDSWMEELANKSFTLDLSGQQFEGQSAAKISQDKITPNRSPVTINWPEKLPGFQASVEVAATTQIAGKKDSSVALDAPALQILSKFVLVSPENSSSKTPSETIISDSRKTVTEPVSIKTTSPRLALESTNTSLGIALTQVTGTIPFDADDLPGHDSSGTNTVVRTADNLTYNFSYSVNGGDAANTIITMNLPSAMAWTDLPAICRTTGVTPTSTIIGQTLTCNLGPVPNGSTGLFSAVTKVQGVANGTSLTVDARISADGVTAVTSNQVTASVSAAPAYNLRKVGATLIGASIGSDGVTKGQVVTYGIQVLVDSSNYRGQEPLATNFSLTDNLSAISPNAKLYNWEPSLPGCGPVNGASGLSNLSPYGRIGIAAGATSENSVIDSGNFTCSQTGNLVNININNANTGGSSFPTKQKNSTTLISASEKYYISGYIAVWIPITDIGSGINTTNTLTNFDPNSISGQSNYGSGGEQHTTDNSTTFFVPGAVGGFSTLVWQNPIPPIKLPTQTGAASGDGLVAPGQVYGARYTFNNQGVVALNNLIVCGKINNTKNIVSNFVGQSSPVNVAISPGVSYVVEYMGGGFASDEAASIGTCGTYGDSTGWTTDPNAIGLANITKVRIRVATLQPTGFIRLNVGYQALPGVVGTRIGVYGAYRADELCGGGAWRFGRGGLSGACTNTVIYDPATHNQSVGDTGDRVTLAGAVVRIAKTASAGTMVAGGRMTFSLAPTITNPESSSAGIASNVTITDTLPSWLTYNIGSSSGGPIGLGQPGVTVNGDGTTTLIWNLGSQPANVVIPPITFVSTASLAAPNNTNVTNTAIINSPDDASAASQRTASVTVVIANPGVFAIAKSVITPNLSVGEDIVYHLTYSNLSGIAIPGTDMIDILPWNGDTRTPRTNFHGTVSLKSVVVSNGETLQFTKATSASINIDPAHASNQSGGATVWCSSYSAGGSCPASLAEVTAIRVMTGNLPGGVAGRNIVVRLMTSGNLGADTYSNNFGGRAQGLSLPVFSSTVSGVVTGIPVVNLLKSCPVPADCTTAPQLAGTALTYRVVFTNIGNAAAQSLVIFDPIPGSTDFKIGSPTFDAGTTGLSVAIEFSNDFNPAASALATWTYAPVSGGGGANTGYDRNVKAVRWRVTTGNLGAVPPDNTGEVGFTVKIR